MQGKIMHLITYVEVSSPSFGNVDMPCRCLCLGFAEQITNICPRRLTILQNWHSFFTDDRTFMVTGKWKLIRAIKILSLSLSLYVCIYI